MAPAIPRHALKSKYQRGDALSKGELISLEETVTIYLQRLYDISWLMRNLMNTSLAKLTKKINVLAGFIRCHPWRSPFGPAEAVQIFSRKICGKADLNLKLC